MEAELFHAERGEGQDDANSDISQIFATMRKTGAQSWCDVLKCRLESIECG